MMRERSAHIALVNTSCKVHAAATRPTPYTRQLRALRKGDVITVRKSDVIRIEPIHWGRVFVLSILGTTILSVLAIVFR